MFRGQTVGNDLERIKSLVDFNYTKINEKIYVLVEGILVAVFS